MSEDVPLTAFEGGDDEPEGDESDDAEPDAGRDSASDPAGTPSLTYTSSPDGALCAACGETVEKRWRAGEGGVSADENGEAEDGGDENAGVDDPDALVCPGCKEW